MQVASKRQRLEEPPRKPRSPISEERQRQYNCSSCGGSRLAGMGGPYKLREDRGKGSDFQYIKILFGHY